jgi:hypothetical protein
MLTDLNGRSARRYDDSQHRVGPDRQMNQGELRLGGDGPAEQRHLAPETGVAEAGAEGLAYRFLRSPEVQECLEFFGLAGHPGELGGGEPAVGQGGDVPGIAVLEVYADWARQAGGDRDEALTVADAHPERVDVGTAGGVVAQYGGMAEQGAGELEEQGVSSRSLVAVDGFQPDVHGGQIGARTLNHRKKVSR